MGKPRAVGSDVIVLFCEEAVYATAPNGGAGNVYTRPYLKSEGLSGSQPLEGDELINTGSPDDTDPSLGALDVSGDIVAPFDATGAGFWLRMALGPEPAGAVHDEEAGTYLHTWTSGQDLKSYTKQLVHPKLTTPKYRSCLGAKAGGFSFPLQRNGRAMITIPMLASIEVKDNASHDANPKTFAYLPFDNCTGEIKLDDVVVANITGGQFDYSNNLDNVEAIRPDSAIDGSDEAIRTATGSLTIRIGTDHTIDDLVDANSPAAMEISFTLKSDATRKLTFSLPRVFFELAKKPVDGPGGVSATVNWRAARDAVTPAPMLSVTLLNDVAAY